MCPSFICRTDMDRYLYWLLPTGSYFAGFQSECSLDVAFHMAEISHLALEGDSGATELLTPGRGEGYICALLPAS